MTKTNKKNKLQEIAFPVSFPTILFWIAVFSAIIFLISIFPQWNTFYNAVGISASTVGIIIVMLQLLLIKKEQTIVVKTIQETKQSLLSKLKVFDLSKYVNTCNEIQSSVRTKNYEIVLYKLNELKGFLIELSSIDDDIDETRMTNSISSVIVIINDIDKWLQIKDQEPNGVVLNKQIEEIKSMFHEIQASIKYT